ncbi:uncharacterized protein LOC126827057 [Patella vulgata]|uniref:uncharacterized protein LOC126827057 n=1 Tax=Patella vulgata TaxID=6465 RepID=UPI00217FA2CD|nr:uncharacterized protein LOC126827057 [Patella vulgata]
MADLSKNLKDYLSRSSNTQPLIDGSSNKSKYKIPGMGFLRRPTEDEDMVSNDSANGWFQQAQKDPLLPSLSKKQRIIGFIICLLMGTFCFSLASLYLPMLVFKSRKFAALYTMGSLFVISCFSFLWGPVHHVKHLLSGPRIPFTLAYFGSMFATLYFALWVHRTVLTIVFASAQITALIWYIVSYIPGGQTGLKFFSKVFYAAASKTAGATLPI